MSKLRPVMTLSALVLMAGLASPGWSFDENLAASYAQLFASAKEGQTGKALHCIKPEGLINMLKKGEPVVGLDVRTPVEMSVFTVVLPGSMSIPINELFLPVNLARIPKDRTVVVMCHSGLRAGIATTALRQLGFDKVFVLQGGFKGLSDYLDPVTAYSPLPPAAPPTH
ncbi:MAG: rhodanese-like domain-containing protein [Chromatiaceae bacterium]|nr:rhodanese-like domain-containing protein [Chromatiaceae bacterium]MBP8290279.1 rhodanese-like domain-containing protein [Chromatiaceae bacterium]MBP9603710.1 rhodanese-like domain-containing protein [Chromatiaceae bacterium]